MEKYYKATREDITKIPGGVKLAMILKEEGDNVKLKSEKDKILTETENERKECLKGEEE